MWRKECQMANQRHWKWRLNFRLQNNLFFLWMVAIALSTFPSVRGLRCYTDVMATKAQSVECGLNTGCVKIFVDSEEIILRRNQQYGYVYPTGEGGGAPALPEKYLDNPILLRGCFVLAVPDRCYTANNGLTYCWCSTKDLCNNTNTIISKSNITMCLCVGVMTVMLQLLVKSFLLSAPGGGL